MWETTTTTYLISVTFPMAVENPKKKGDWSVNNITVPLHRIKYIKDLPNVGPSSDEPKSELYFTDSEEVIPLYCTALVANEYMNNVKSN